MSKKKTKKSSKKSKTAKKEKKSTKKASKKAKGPGVIASIVEILKNHGPITKEGIVKRLVKRFPDRNEDSMLSTVNVQIPGRISREKGLKLVQIEKGKKKGAWKVK